MIFQMPFCPTMIPGLFLQYLPLLGHNLKPISLMQFRVLSSAPLEYRIPLDLHWDCRGNSRKKHFEDETHVSVLANQNKHNKWVHHTLTTVSDHCLHHEWRWQWQWLAAITFPMTSSAPDSGCQWVHNNIKSKLRANNNTEICILSLCHFWNQQEDSVTIAC